jgi:small subunit ribosomal protein S2
MSNLPHFTLADLLDAGVHYGHKANRWNPKMAPYIYGAKDGVHIIDLQQTAPMLKAALQVIYDTVKNNGRVLFVGTKVQASPIVAEFAEKCGQYYVNHRWLGGMITNWGTVSKSIKTLDSLEAMVNDPEQAATYTKKELLEISRKRDKLVRSLGGIRNMGGKPDLLVVIDTNKESLAITEAKKLHVPTIAIVDTNSDPDIVDYPIAGNDDAIRSIRLYCHLFAEAALAGIKEALTSSGVDIGALENAEDLSKAAKKVSKMKPNRNKVNAKGVAVGVKEGKAIESTEFENALSDKIANESEKN